MATKTLKEITLNGNIHPNAAALLGLSPETKVEFRYKYSRMRGTGYLSEVYRILGTDDAVVVDRNCYAASNGSFYDDARLEKGRFAKQRSYGAACRIAAQRHGVPMETALAVGPDLLGELVGLAEANIKRVEEFEWELTNCGINRRKNAILCILNGCSPELDEKVSSMGQRNSTRVADYLWNLFQGCFVE